MANSTVMIPQSGEETPLDRVDLGVAPTATQATPKLHIATVPIEKTQFTKVAQQSIVSALEAAVVDPAIVHAGRKPTAAAGIHLVRCSSTTGNLSVRCPSSQRHRSLVPCARKRIRAVACLTPTTPQDAQPAKEDPVMTSVLGMLRETRSASMPPHGATAPPPAVPQCSVSSHHVFNRREVVQWFHRRASFRSLADISLLPMAHEQPTQNFLVVAVSPTEPNPPLIPWFLCLPSISGSRLARKPRV